MATTVLGGERTLADELRKIADCHSLVEAKAQVFFQGSTRTGLEAVMKLRTSLRVMERVIDSDDVESKDDLYNLVKSVDWTSILSPDQTIKVDTTVGQVSKDLSHSHFSSLTVKNAIVDQFRDRTNRRPSVDIDKPNLPLLLYMNRGRATLYRIWSGDASMHKRGYRESIHRAALRETTASLIVQLSQWTANDGTLCDPMCGSGTIPIEAALLATNCYPGLLKYTKTDECPVAIGWGDLDAAMPTWESVFAEAKAGDQRRHLTEPLIYANDIHEGALALANQAARFVTYSRILAASHLSPMMHCRAAGVSHLITFSSGDVGKYVPPSRPNVVITNPPWDMRLAEGADEAWHSLGDFARREMKERAVWALSGNPDISRHIKLKASVKMPINAASVDMRLLRYDVRDADAIVTITPKSSPSDGPDSGAFTLDGNAEQAPINKPRLRTRRVL